MTPPHPVSSLIHLPYMFRTSAVYSGRFGGAGKEPHVGFVTVWKGDMRLRRRFPYPSDPIVTGIPSVDRRIDALSARMMGATPRLADRTAKSIVVCGYPRSGNVFAAEYLRLALPDAHVISNRHSPLKIQTAAEARVPVIIPVREPRDAVASWMVYLDAPVTAAQAERHLKGYIAWHRYALRVRCEELSRIMPFTTITDSPASIAEWAPIKALYPEYASNVQSAAVVARIQDAADRGFVANPATQQSVPHPERGTLAKRYLELLDAPGMAGPMREAQEMFARALDQAHRSARQLTSVSSGSHAE